MKFAASLLLTAPVALAACGSLYADELNKALEPARQAEAKAKREAQAAWLLLGCEVCLLRQHYLSNVGCTSGSAEPDTRNVCIQVGCHPLGDFESCQSFTEQCRDSNL
jgi:hypothetical protein